MTPAEIYAAMVKYLEQNGWHREEAGSAWWWHDEHLNDATMGEAVGEQLHKDGIDARTYGV